MGGPSSTLGPFAWGDVLCKPRPELISPVKFAVGRADFFDKAGGPFERIDVERLGSQDARRCRGNGLLAALLVGGMLIALPRTSPAASPSTSTEDLPSTVLEEFRGICSDLTAVRELLAAGRIDEVTFADSLLALFARADSLAQSLAAGHGGNPARITLQRGTAYLIESIRDNWVGIAGENGMSFAEADTALKAALAWRSNVAEVSSP